MKVVLATHRTNQWLGVNKYFYLLGKYLSLLGVEVHIIVDSLEGCRAIKEICGDSVEVVRLSPTAIGVLSTARYCWNLRHYLSRIDFNVLHCGHILPFLYLMKGQRKPVVFQPFGNELFSLAGRGMNRVYCRICQPVLRFCGEQADVLLAEGGFQLVEMLIYYPKATWITFLPVGVDIDTIKPKAIYTSDKQFQFLSVNSLLPYEGMGDLIGAFRGMNNGSKLVIVGTGSEENKLKKMARGLPVEFKKNLKEWELRLLYAESDAFVCPTYEADFQMGVLEAMASGLPVISREARWLPNPVMRFKDKSELLESMAMISAIPLSKRAEIGKKGLEEVKQYSFTIIAQKALKIYYKVIEKESKYNE